MMETTAISVHENLDFFCTAEWHLSRLNKYAALVYAHALHVTSKARRNGQPPKYFPALTKIAAYYGADLRSIRKAVRELVKSGFFVKLKELPGKPISYRPVEHKEWAGRFPNRCLVKLEQAWSDIEKDDLVIRLHAASAGRLILRTNFVKGMRNTGLSDGEIETQWNVFDTAENSTGQHLYGRFMKHLRAFAETKN